MDKINKVADIAGVLKRKGMVQTLSYSQSWMKEEFKLLELPPELLDVLTTGQRLVIRGDTDDDTVLCTGNSTFDLKAADTSNSMLVIPDLVVQSQDILKEETCINREVVTCFTSYYEVKPIRPHLERLRSMLEENAFMNKDSDMEGALEAFTTDGLLSLIQASETEVLAALKNLGALKINGYWRVLETAYKERAFAQVLALVEEKSWDWKRVPVVSCCSILEELYPRFVVEHCLNIYGDGLTCSDVASSDVMVCLSEEKVCKFYAEYILRPVDKFNYNEFLEAWRLSVPDGMTTKKQYLCDIALIDEKSHPPFIWHFPEKSLPENQSLRFNVLFKERNKWRHADIEPYLRNVLDPGQALSALLLKFTRSATGEDGGKVYSSKRPIK